MESEPLASIWNFDGAEYYSIYQLKSKFILFMSEWKLDQAYWVVRLLRMELDAKLKVKSKKRKESDDETEEEGMSEKDEVDDMLKRVSEFKVMYDSHKNPSPEQTTEYFQILENFYMYICRKMKQHGFYFRESEDMSKAIFRR